MTRLAPLALALALFAACDRDHVAPDAASTDAFTPPPASLTVVIGAFASVRELTTSRFGIDLDGSNGLPPGAAPGGCQDQPDYVSPITGARGVDNAFVLPESLELETVYVSDAIDESIRAGEPLVAIRISDIDSFVEDASVRVHLTRVAPSASPPLASTACAAELDPARCDDVTAGPCFWSYSIGRCTGLEPGQSFTELDELGTFEGSVHRGRLRAAFDTIPLALSSIVVLVHGGEIAGAIAPDGITAGELAGWLSVDELDASIATLDPSGTHHVRDSFTPDLHPRADPTVCDALSAGFGFSAVLASLD